MRTDGAAVTARWSITRRSKVLALTAVATLTVSGCGGVAPGSAIEVEDTRISHERVDSVAAALCAANLESAAARGEAPPIIPARGAREGALQVLLDTALSHAFGEERGVEPNQNLVSMAMAQNEVGLRLLPPDRREAFSTALREYAEGQAMLIEVGRQSLEDAGRTDVTDQEALAEGERLRAEFVESADVEIDPRYGSFESGELRLGGQSLSVAVSDTARQAGNPNAGAAWAAQLPASLQCS